MPDPNGSSPDESARAQLPAAPEVEDAVVGAGLIDRAAALVVAGIALEDFFIERNARIAAAIRDVIADGGAPDPVLVLDALRVAGHHDIGSDVLHRLFAETPSFSSAPRYAAIIRRHARHRRTVHLAHELSGAAMHGQDNEVRRIVDQLVAELAADEEAAQ